MYKTRKRTTLLLTLLALSLLAIMPVTAQQGDEVIFKAMQDELDRTMDKLVLEELRRPYFVSYTIDDYRDLTIRSSLGSLVEAKNERGRYLTIDLRVGDHNLDNSNFVSGFSGLSTNYSVITIEDDYDALRNQIYLATDRVYKESVKLLSKKQAYLQSRVIKERPADLILQPATRHLGGGVQFGQDTKHFEDLANRASAVLRDYPTIVSSEIKITAGLVNQYLINSNDAKTRRGDRTYVINLSLSGKSEEGEDVNTADRLIVNNLKNIPDGKQLTQWVRANADQLAAAIAAETIDEYAGPVILTDDAVGEFFRQLFIRHVSNNPSPTFENEQVARMMLAPEFGSKLKRRVLPAFFDAYDDPTIDEYGDFDLVGGYEVDDAAGKPQRVDLVEKGKLVNLLIGTAPTKKIKDPNGHARGAVSKPVTAKPANMVFESSDRVSYEELKRSMLEFCQDIDLEYGLVIKKLEDLNAPRDRGFTFFGSPAGKQSELTAPLEVYKVYPDGREEPVRNLEFSNVTVRILRDIVQTSDRQFLYNYLIGDDYEMPVSIVAPAILVEEMELKKSEGKVKKPPILASPLAE